MNTVGIWCIAIQLGIVCVLLADIASAIRG